MVQQWLKDRIQKTKNFMEFAIYCAKKKLTPKVVFGPLVEGLKSFLTMNQRRKISKYRLECQIYRLNQMESSIAQSNNHYFIQGRKIDDLR